MHTKITKLKYAVLIVTAVISGVAQAAGFDSSVFKKEHDCSVCKEYTGHYSQIFPDGKIRVGLFLKTKVPTEQITPLLNEGTKLNCMHSKTLKDSKGFEFVYNCS